jgi:hypothetical protein
MLIINSVFLSAQSKEKKNDSKIDFNISGNFIIATDFESLYTNYGGPAVKFSFSKNIYTSISMYPGLRWKNDPVKPTALPILGTGLHFGYKRLILAMPFYYISNENKWKAAFGIGIKF